MMNEFNFGRGVVMKWLAICLWVLFPLANFGQEAPSTISRTISVTRDGQGRIETLTHPNGKVQEYTYNALTGHETVTYDGSEIVSSTVYGVNGLPKKITYRAFETMPSAVVDYDYDGQNRLLSHKVSMNGTRYYMYNTTFNEWGFLKTYRRNDAGMSNKTITYGYGSRGELTAFTIGGVGTASYDYDNNGNLEERTGFSSGDFQLPAMSAEYDSQTNRRLGWLYDLDGNLTQDDRFIYEYNLLGRLEKIRKISNGRIVAHYLYDSDGMRVRAVVEDKVTYTIRDDQGRVISQEIGQSRMDGGLDVTIKNYVYHNNSNILTVTYHPDGTVTRRYHFRNYLGHPVLVVDEENGFAYEYREYAPYGHQMTVEPQEVPTQQFTGHERDTYASADYMRARYYSWEFGRFNRPDPAFNFDPVNPYSYNLYAYTNNNPVNGYDPGGKVIETVWDMASLGLGIDSFMTNIRDGKILAATFDGIGIVIDAAAVATPGIPGGAGAGIKALRKGGDELVEVAVRSDALPVAHRAMSQADNVWDLNPMLRGKKIEDMLAATEYSSWYRVGAENRGFFPLVDFQKGDTLVSLKTVDTRGNNWMSGIMDHIKDLATRGSGVGGRNANMKLDLRVQPGGAGDASQLRELGDIYGVDVSIKEFQ